MDDHDGHLERYLAEIGKVERLTPEREEQLLARAREGDRDAVRTVVWSYLELAHYLAQELKPDWMQPLVATQEANVILTRVVEAPDVDDIEPALEERLRVAFEKLEAAGPA